MVLRCSLTYRHQLFREDSEGTGSHLTVLQDYHPPIHSALQVSPNRPSLSLLSARSILTSLRDFSERPVTISSTSKAEGQ